MASTCGSEDVDLCRNPSSALELKYIAIASILVAGLVGVLIPIIGKHKKLLNTDGNVFVAAKAFAAGVILATGFVHMLSDGSEALSDPCLPEYPWSKFPFSGFFAMMSALMTLLVDFVGTQYYERKKALNRTGEAEQGRVGIAASNLESGIFPADEKEPEGKVFGEEENGGMHIVGMHAHAAHHSHNHPQGKDACQGTPKRGGDGHCHGHSDGFMMNGDEDGGTRHVVVSQILELGIISHSIIIGLSLGVSESPCTIRPLIAALSFHQFFEGFALGGCISQANFKTLSTVIMACFFAITTPAGIGVGAAIAKTYDADSPLALIIEGILDSMSAGILVYMALVDLIAADFLSRRMSCNFKLQLWSYVMLFLGAGMMSALAIWA